MLVRRESLAFLSSVYPFIIQNYNNEVLLWQSVWRELRWVATLIPLIYTQCDLPFSTTLVVTDASLWGFGAATRQVPIETVRQLAATHERW